MSKFTSQPDERELIDSLRARSGKPSNRQGQFHSHYKSSTAVKLGIGDDCAILRPPHGHEILVTTDFSLETIHFRRDWHSPESAGHRCLARGLSDLAAMGAKPLAAFLSLALPTELVRSRSRQSSWRERFLAGFLALADKYEVSLAGGDTAKSPLCYSGSAHGFSHADKRVTGHALADVVLVGSIPRNRALLRSGAKAGDRIYVTGRLGGTAAELAQLAANPRRFRACIPSGSSVADPNPHPHLFPEPRIAVGAWLVKNHRATAAIDISDGLSTDLDHLCEESGLAATVDAPAIPIHPFAQNSALPVSEKALKMALDGGEDYELLFTASPDMHIPRRIAEISVTCIGLMRRYNSHAPRVLLADQVNGEGRKRPLPPGGWEHYR